ncbi:MAG: triose-phosphate isomerase [Pseudomonadota bacterium]
MSNVAPSSPEKLAAGNWKMNGTSADLSILETIIRDLAPEAGAGALICPPATLLSAAAHLSKATPLRIGAQNCHEAATGAHTGDISAEMLRDAGATHVIVGHSERRADHRETDDAVRAKAEAAQRAGLTAIVCVGETEDEREAGRQIEVVTSQLAGSLPDGATADRTIIAYEPVWAIGTGKAATPADIAEIHGAIRSALSTRFGAQGSAMSLLYGGSVKPANAAEIFAVENVDGALIGGASLKAEDFLAIHSALAAG